METVLLLHGKWHSSDMVPLRQLYGDDVVVRFGPGFAVSCPDCIRALIDQHQPTRLQFANGYEDLATRLMATLGCSLPYGFSYGGTEVVVSYMLNDVASLDPATTGSHIPECPKSGLAAGYKSSPRP